MRWSESLVESIQRKVVQLVEKDILAGFHENQKEEKKGRTHWVNQL